MIIKQYSIKEFKNKHLGLYRDLYPALNEMGVLNDSCYIIRTLENRGEVLQLEIGYVDDEWNLA